MNRDEFKRILRGESYSFHEENEWIVVNNGGSVYLDSLTELSDNVQFNNKGNIYLRSLTELPNNVQFNNKGYVYLSSLTELPDNIQFNNKGDLFLDSLIELPDNIQFNNKGSVYLPSLTELSDNFQFNNEGDLFLDSLIELPDNIQFNNKGFVFLDSLPDGQYEYKGQSIYLKNIDGYAMIIDKTKSINEIEVHICRFFGGGPIDQLKKCYVAESNGLYAHGSTVKVAIEDLKYKLSKNKDISEVIEEIKEASKVTLDQFRMITGACREGIRQHLSQFEIDLNEIDTMDLDEAIEKMKDTPFGYEFIKQLG